MTDSKEVPPCTETGSKLLEIWANVLENPNVNVNDDFVALGGDSLSAMVCISRIAKIFKVEIPLEFFFLDGGTISNLASLIDQQALRGNP